MRSWGRGLCGRGLGSWGRCHRSWGRGYRVGVMGQFLHKRIQKGYGRTDGLSESSLLELLIAAKKNYPNISRRGNVQLFDLLT